MKCDSRKGDFYNLVKKDMEDLDIAMTEEDIREHTRTKWKVLVSKKWNTFVFTKLINENEKLDNTKHIEFDELKLSNYLHDNRDIKLSKIIFSVRSKTLDLKTLNPCKYYDNLA